ncbi:hypothetical protein CLOM_g9955 [Closterium sp. NIES-68]|nr:hypothetical protein CLOM_g9955 [Closterium sp. NIES-68]GJP68447.1 hypothetical protein CLOP_g25153 [Closterium sp. NIES-67]GJP87063.1 hypothetical protein CLOP_g17035 [Closterium sp. NIES-67]
MGNPSSAVDAEKRIRVMRMMMKLQDLKRRMDGLEHSSSGGEANGRQSMGLVSTRTMFFSKRFFIRRLLGLTTVLADFYT